MGEIIDGMDIDQIFDALKMSSIRWIQMINFFDTDKDLNTDFYFHFLFDREPFKRKRNRAVMIYYNILNHGTHYRRHFSGALTQLCVDSKPIELDL